MSVFTKSASFRQDCCRTRIVEEIRRQSENGQSIGLYLGRRISPARTNRSACGHLRDRHVLRRARFESERGRLFSEGKRARHEKPVVALSHQLWRQRYNEDASAIGQTLTVNGTPLTIVGVMAPPFEVTEVPGDGYHRRRRHVLPAARFPRRGPTVPGRSCSASWLRPAWASRRPMRISTSSGAGWARI